MTYVYKEPSIYTLCTMQAHNYHHVSTKYTNIIIILIRMYINEDPSITDINGDGILQLSL